METQVAHQTKFSVPSILAIIAAVVSFMTGAFWGFLLAVAAVVLGLIGVIMAFSTRTRGGLVSTLAVLGGLLGLIAAIVKGIAWLA